MCKASDDEPDSTALSELFKTKVGAAMFRKEALDSGFTEFSKAIATQLYALEVEGLSEDTVSGFKAQMRQRCRRLAESGHQPWTKTKLHECVFLGEGISLEYMALVDHWQYPLESRLRTLCVHLNLVTRLPWEQLLFGKDGPVGKQMPSAVRIDDGLLTDIKNTRKAILSVFSKYPVESFEDQMKVVKLHCGHIKKGDRFAVLEFGFLEKAEKLADGMVRSELFEAFPSPTAARADRSVDAAIAKLNELRQKPLLLASSETLISDVDTVLKMCTNIAKGAAPSEMEFSRMSSFYQKVLQHAERYCCCTIQKKCEIVGKLMIRDVFARDAVFVHWQRLQQAKPGKEQTEACRELRPFAWLLTDEQRSSLQDVVNKAIVAVRQSQIGTQAALEDNSVQVQGGAGASSSSSKGSASTIVPADPAMMAAATLEVGKCVGAKQTKAEKKRQSDSDIQRDLLLDLLKRTKAAA